MPLKSQICILEMGMNNKGEIKRLAKIARPNVNIITNIGTAHVGNLVNRKGIAREKSDIFFYSNQKDCSIIPSDDEFYEFLKGKASKKFNLIYTFGKNKISTFQYFDNGYEDKIVKFKIFDKEYNFQKKISFNNWENNVVLILGLIKILNLKVKSLKKKIEQLKPIEGRGKLHSIKVNNKKIILIDESYNSSPDSLKKSIENLRYFKKIQGRIICIIGDMLELGKNSTKMHIEVSEILKKVKPEIVYTVGKHSVYIQKGLPKTIKSHHFVDYKKIYNEITRIIKTNDVIMIKGSNSSKVNFISKQLIESE
jgi:UDP-N-acetylmuramyl pentapeptide synthase